MLSINEYNLALKSIDNLMDLIRETDIEFDKFCSQSHCGDCPLFETDCQTLDYLEYLESER